MSIHLNGKEDSFLSNLPLQPQSISHRVSIVLIIGCSNNTKIDISGQTLKQVGVWLRTEIFAHGQLYVASSRVGDPNALKFAIKKNKDGLTEDVSNVVYKEVLLNNS